MSGASAVWLAVMAALPLQAQDAPLRLDGPNIGLSKMIPIAGEEVTLRVPLVAPDDHSYEGTVRLRAWASRDGGDPIEIASPTASLSVAAGQSRDVEVVWRPTETGFYVLRLEVSLSTGEPQRAELGPVAVVAHELYFAWFGAPKTLRWCNVPTTVKAEDAAWWLRRGAVPCAWKGALCYKEWPQDKFVEHYGSSRWIAIDEIGGPGEDTDKFMAALRELKRAQPERFTAVWFIGAHEYWSGVTDAVDLFIPEVYLNYRGNHLGIFDPYLERARAAGVMPKMVCGLGINIIKDEETKEPRVTPTREDVLRQIRYLKRVAPDMPGVGFFTSSSAAEGVAEYADELCGEYFVKPVVTIRAGGLAIEPGTPPQAKVTLANVGGMAARDVAVRVTQRHGDDAPIVDRTARLKTLDSGETREVSVGLQRAPGISLISAEVAASPQHTLLDSLAETPFCPPAGLSAGLREALALAYLAPWDAGERRDVPVSWALDGPPPEVHVVELDETGRAKAEVPSLGLQERGQTVVRWVAAGVTPREARRLFAVLPGPVGPGATPALQCEEADGRLRIRGPHYAAELDPATNALTSLVPVGSSTELLKSRWVLTCPGHEGFGTPEIARSPGWVAVTVPFDSDLVGGASRYVFSALTPAIEVSRTLTPKAALTVEGAGDGCRLEQRGGGYALQPGVGGVVNRGALQDSTEYRDLYFGYLGGGPTERNATLPGWLDFSWDPQWNAGLGVAIVERWRDAAYASYDVTRLYDASDWLEVSYVWGKSATVEREQTSRLFLVPHTGVDMQEAAVPPARAVWEAAHDGLRPIPG